LVTGGSRGIGAATVKAIASAAGSVVVHYGSNKGAAEKLRSELGPDNCALFKIAVGFRIISQAYNRTIRLKKNGSVIRNKKRIRQRCGKRLTQKATG
jgi:NAD(P)-dependent dehydrogenase (short-subunit alcohol dehydrogenase family)